MQTIDRSENRTLKSIDTIGKIVAVAGGLIILCNSIGGVAFALIKADEFFRTNRSGFDLGNLLSLEFILLHFRELCMIMVAIGICFVVGGILMVKRNRWARYLLSTVSIILAAAIWITTIAVMTSIIGDQNLTMFRIAAIGSAALYSVPLLLLTVFLNQAKNRIYFS